jgi:hypothetical protein
MKSRLHAAAGTGAILCILVFWVSTLVSELFLSPEAVVTVKQGILRAMWFLIPALIATAGSGFALAKIRAGRLIEQKKRRMPFIALNGVLILLPSAYYLCQKATAGEFDHTFIAIQALELLAGAINLTLLALNFRDGLRLARRSQGDR